MGKDLEAAAFARVRDAIRQGFVEGQTTDQIVRRIRGTRANQYRDGILEISRRSAESVVRTAINHTANVARQELYKANDDLIDSWRFVATCLRPRRWTTWRSTIAMRCSATTLRYW